MFAVTGKPQAQFTFLAAIAASQTHSPAKRSLALLVDPASESAVSPVPQNGTNDSVAAGTDIAINNNLLTDIRLGYYRYNIVTSKYNQGVDFADQMGIPGLNTGTSYTSGSPAFEIDQKQSNRNGFLGSGLNVNRCNCQLTEKEQQGQVVNNWTKILGNHAFKFGADLRYATNLRVPSDNNRTGQLAVPKRTDVQSLPQFTRADLDGRLSRSETYKPSSAT